MSRYFPALVLALLAACRPELREDDSLVTSARVLAVKSEPAEAKPGTPLTLTAFIATPASVPSAPQPTWSFCDSPKSVTENNVVSSACLAQSSLIQAGQGSPVTAAAPLDACSLFGPDTPPGGYRPRDPDATGGYFQPLSVDLSGADPTFHLERILCNLGDASADIATEYGLAYVPNQNPHLLPVLPTVAGKTVTFDAVPRSARVELEAAWAAEDAESYAYFDRAAQVVSTRREAMDVAWYASDGQFDTEVTGRAEDDLALSTSNGWVAPSSAGQVTLWVVLRDSRGGVDFTEYSVTVSP